MGERYPDEEDTDTDIVTGPMGSKKDMAPTTAVTGDAIVVVLQPARALPGRRYALAEDEHVVGRRADLEIPLDLVSVSRRHARFFREDGHWWVEDLSSTNGSFVNESKIEKKRRLRDGDLVRFGEAVLKFLVGSNIEVAYHEEIYRLSVLDGLTGVHNRSFFMEYLERELARANRHNGTISLVMFDIDHFKNVNDTLGHPAGDAVLTQLCRRLRPRVRRDDLLARIGGEEFACVLSDTPHGGATQFAEALRVIIEREPFLYEGKSVSVTISLGVETILPGQKIEGSDLIRVADQKLYEAKRRGRNRVVA